MLSKSFSSYRKKQTFTLKKISQQTNGASLENYGPLSGKHLAIGTARGAELLWLRNILLSGGIRLLCEDEMISETSYFKLPLSSL
jgi:hypothetical protein